MISVIIPTSNRKEDIRRCLDSIDAQTFRDYEVIVVDDCSTEDIKSEASREKTSYIRNNVNIGPACSRNIAVNASKGDILLFLDSDTELPEYLMQNINDTLLSDATIGCLGGCGPQNPKTEGVEYVKAKYYERSGQNKSIVLAPEMFDSEPLIFCDHFESACLGIRRDVFQQTKGFDPYWFYMGEDRELCLKVRRMGYKCAVGLKTAAIHHEQDLEVKITSDQAQFFSMRYLEVAYKLDGIPGAFRWLRTNKLLNNKAHLKKFASLICNNQLMKYRRNADFLSESAIEKYKESRINDR